MYRTPFQSRDTQELAPEVEAAYHAAESATPSGNYEVVISPLDTIRANTRNVLALRRTYLDGQLGLTEANARPSVFRGILSLITGSDMTESPRSMSIGRKFGQVTERDLITRESIVGGQLFGAVPADHRREFFCLDDTTWIWYEESTDVKTGATQPQTVRYEIHEKGILKAYDGAQYNFIQGDELRNLVLSVNAYYTHVAGQVYDRDPVTGKLGYHQDNTLAA